MDRVISHGLAVGVATSITAFATAILPGFAIAAPPPTSAVSQYVEMIPTSSGGQAVGVTQPRARAASLPSKANAALARLAAHSRRQATRLKTVATDPKYGAGQQTTSRLVGVQPRLPTPVPAVLGALTSGGLVLPLLGGAMLLTTIVVVVAAIRGTGLRFDESRMAEETETFTPSPRR